MPAGVEVLVEVGHVPDHAPADVELAQQLLHALFQLADVDLAGQDFTGGRLEHRPARGDEGVADAPEHARLAHAGLADDEKRRGRTFSDRLVHRANAGIHPVGIDDLGRIRIIAPQPADRCEKREVDARGLPGGELPVERHHVFGGELGEQRFEIAQRLARIRIERVTQLRLLTAFDACVDQIAHERGHERVVGPPVGCFHQRGTDDRPVGARDEEAEQKEIGPHPREPQRADQPRRSGGTIFALGERGTCHGGELRVRTDREIDELIERHLRIDHTRHAGAKVLVRLKILRMRTLVVELAHRRGEVLQRHGREIGARGR